MIKLFPIILLAVAIFIAIGDTQITSEILTLLGILAVVSLIAAFIVGIFFMKFKSIKG